MFEAKCIRMYPIYFSKYHTLSHKGADPDAEDGFGNTVLHMVVVTDQMVKNKITTFDMYQCEFSKTFLNL